MRLRCMANWLAGTFLFLLFLLLFLALAVAVFAYGKGHRIASLAWHDGPVLSQWQYWQGHCLSVAADKMQVQRLWPLQLSVGRLDIANCGDASGRPAPPRWLPPFDVHITRLGVPGLPPASVHVRQQQRHWQLQVKSRRDVLAVTYDGMSGRWRLQGQLAAAALHPDVRGVVAVQGHGVWLAASLSGALTIRGKAMAYRDHLPQGAFTASAVFTGDKWQLQLSPVLPMALTGGWYLESAPMLHFAGVRQRLTALRLGLRVRGPKMSLSLRLEDHDGHLDDVRGVLRLKGAVSGVVPLQWNGREIRLRPATLHLAEGGKVRWDRDVTLPLVRNGESKVSLIMHHAGLYLQTRDSQLVWQGARWWWQGKLELKGRQAGAAITGSWQGRIDQQGFKGGPARFFVRHRQWQVHGSLPLQGRWSSVPPLQIKLQGHYADYPLSGRIDALFANDVWTGRARILSRLPFYTQGGAVDLDFPWRYQQGQWQWAKGGLLTIDEGVFGGVLIRPVAIGSEQGLMLRAGLPRGRLRLTTAGMLAARWQVPAMDGEIVLDGGRGQVNLSVPTWQSALKLTAVLTQQPDGRLAPTGTLSLLSPLHDDMARSLNIGLQKGLLKAEGVWQWQKALQLTGEVTLDDVDLAWQAARVSGGRGRWGVRLAEGGVFLHSLSPITVSEVAMGVVLRQLKLEMKSDLKDWQFNNVGVDVLGGQVTATGLQWPSAQFQPVVVSHLDLAALLALQSDPQKTVKLAGLVGGVLPLQWQSGGMAIRAGVLRNEGALQLQVLPSAGVSAMAQSNASVRLALDTLSELAISELETRLDMSADGWLDATAIIKGQHPQQKGPPVILNYTHRENVLELLRSVRMADELSQRVLDKQKAVPLP